MLNLRWSSDSSQRLRGIPFISDFHLPDRYKHKHQPIGTALRHSQSLDIEIEYKVISAAHSARRALAAFFHLPTEIILEGTGAMSVT